MDSMPNLPLALEDLNGDDLIAVELGMVVLIKQSLDVAVDAVPHLLRAIKCKS